MPSAARLCMLQLPITGQDLTSGPRASRASDFTINITATPKAPTEGLCRIGIQQVNSVGGGRNETEGPGCRLNSRLRLGESDFS